MVDTRALSRPKLLTVGGDVPIQKVFILESPQVDWKMTSDCFLPEMEVLGNPVVKRANVTTSRNFQLIDTELRFSRK